MSNNYLVNVILSGIAVHHLTQLLIYEEGPADIFVKLRAKVGVYSVLVNDGMGLKADHWIGRLFLCPYCLAGWVAIPFALAFSIRWLPMRMIAIWGVIWAISDHLFDRENN